MPIYRAYNFQRNTYLRSALQFSRNLHINLSAADRAECKNSSENSVRKIDKLINKKANILMFLIR